jgi:outer membrane protein assembly factor BamB
MYTALSQLVVMVLLAGQWPEFRGPNGTGLSGDAQVPVKWSETENVRWKVPVHGRAWSSPVVLGQQLWLTTATPDGKQLFAMAFDKDTGRTLYDLKLFEVETPQFAHAFNTYASPSPVIEPGRVYVTFGSPGTAAIDTKSGKVIWERRDLECNHFRGAGSSPIIFRDLLIMHFDGSDVQYVAALDKRTGRTIWKTPRTVDFKDIEPNGKIKADGDFRKAFATPQIVMAGGQPVLVSSGSMAAYGYDPMTGKELWRLEERTSFSASTRPVAGHGLVFYSTGFNTGQVLAVRPDGRGDVTNTHVAWRSTRGAPKKPSLLLSDDLLFMVNDNGVVTCVEAKTGTEVWTGRLGQTFSASPIGAGGRVYFFGEDGKATIIEAGRSFKVLAENTLDDGFMATPAIDGPALYARTKSHLYRIETAAAR